MPRDCSSNARGATRRQFVQAGSAFGAASTLIGVGAPPVHAAEGNTIQLALVGCGGRGRGAAVNALSVPDAGPVKLVAMADLFVDKLPLAEKMLRRRLGRRVDVPPERQFGGFDAYRQAIDCLRPGDVALLTAYAYCRAAHFDYAVEKGVHVFMEKPFAPDPAGCRRMLQLGAAATKKNLKIATGLMCRHSLNRQALIRKIRDGEIGDVSLIRASHLVGGFRLRPRLPEQNEIEYQVRNFPFFLWASGGIFSEFMISQIDECCWLKNAWPVSARGVGGRSPQNQSGGQNFDSYGVEYTFADGATALVLGRYLSGCDYDFHVYAHGAKHVAQLSGSAHRGKGRIYAGHQIDDDHVIWQAPVDTSSLHQVEWNVLIDAIRNDRPHNETQRAVFSNLATIMGRAAVHSGRKITWDDVTKSDFRFGEYADTLNFDSEPPVRCDDQGRYPVATPGQWVEV